MSEQNTENKGNNNLVKIIVGILVFAIVGFLLYSYYLGNKKNPNSGFLEKLTSGKDAIVEKKAEEFNYAFKFNGNIEAVDKEGKTIGSGSVMIGESQVYSTKDALKQRLKLKDVAISESGNEVFKINSVDMVSDMFKNYFSFESDNKSEILAGLQQIQHPLAKNIATNLSNTGSYVMIDNEKTILKTLGELSKNETIKQLFLSTGLSNPKAYLEANGTLKKLKEELKSDALLNYIFKNSGEPIKEDGKTKQLLVLNEKVCMDYLPFVNNLFTQISQVSGEVNPLGALQLEDCNKNLEQMNAMLQVVVQMYKIGDLEAGNYDFVMGMGNVYNAKITYKSHKLTTWEVSGQSPNKKDFVLNILGDANGIKNSLIQVDIKDEVAKQSIKGEIKNGVGSIVIDSENKENGVFGSLKVKDYFLENIDIQGQANAKEVFTIKGKVLKDTIDIQVEFDENGKKSIFHLATKNNYLKLNLDSSFIKANFLCDNGKIEGNYDAGMVKMGLTGNYNNLKDFSFKLIDVNNPKINYGVAEAKREGTVIKYTGRLVDNSEAIISVDAKLSEGKKDDYKTITLDGVFTSQDMGGGKLKFDLEFLHKKGGAKFEIPTNFNELDISYFEMVTLPAMNPVVIEQQIEMMKPFLGGVFLASGIFGFIAPYSYLAQPTTNNIQVESDFNPVDFKVDDMQLDNNSIDVNIQ